jgi:hypothetical protein
LKPEGKKNRREYTSLGTHNIGAKKLKKEQSSLGPHKLEGNIHPLEPII